MPANHLSVVCALDYDDSVGHFGIAVVVLVAVCVAVVFVDQCSLCCRFAFLALGRPVVCWAEVFHFIACVVAAGDFWCFENILFVFVRLGHIGLRVSDRNHRIDHGSGQGGHVSHQVDPLDRHGQAAARKSAVYAMQNRRHIRDLALHLARDIGV